MKRLSHAVLFHVLTQFTTSALVDLTLSPLQSCIRCNLNFPLWEQAILQPLHSLFQRTSACSPRPEWSLPA